MRCFLCQTSLRSLIRCLISAAMLRHFTASSSVPSDAGSPKIPLPHHRRIYRSYLQNLLLSLPYQIIFFWFKPIGKLCKPFNIREKYCQIFPVIFLVKTDFRKLGAIVFRLSAIAVKYLFSYPLIFGLMHRSSASGETPRCDHGPHSKKEKFCDQSLLRGRVHSFALRDW